MNTNLDELPREYKVNPRTCFWSVFPIRVRVTILRMKVSYHCGNCVLNMKYFWKGGFLFFIIEITAITVGLHSYYFIDNVIYSHIKMRRNIYGFQLWPKIKYMNYWSRRQNYFVYFFDFLINQTNSVSAKPLILLPLLVL